MGASTSHETWDEAIERCVSAAERQGLPRHVTDPTTLELIARTVTAQRDERGQT